MNQPTAFLMTSLIVGAVPLVAGAAETTYPVGTACATGVFPACEPAQEFTITTGGALSAEVNVTFTCPTAVLRFSVDGALLHTSDPVAIGGSTGTVDLGPVTPGTHTLTIGADLPLLISCDERTWTGVLTVTTSGVAASDAATVAPGEMATVSTIVAGSTLGGVRATLFHSQAATSDALISVARYDGLPSGLPSPPPIRTSAFLDLQLSGADFEDTIAGEFLPPSPIQPSPPPILPPSPIFPTDPTLPPSPIRLAYWDGDAWSAVFGATSGPSGPPILPAYDSVTNLFSVTFDLTSTPAVTALTGTVFSIIPGYWFRGFGIPVDAGALNVAKAGRAIPLKWQLFDIATAPMLDLDPAIVKLSSVAIHCEASGSSTDAVEEYAAGASGLQNLGDGVYQVNWATLKSFAGSCRRVRLDLGERNPDGTVFHRTADFQFTR
jgi:hypothetical protein